MHTSIDNDSLIKAVLSPIPKVRSLRKYLAKGADINCQTSVQGLTPLMIAVQGQHDRIAEYLLRLGANPLIKNNEKRIASELISQNCTVYPIVKDFELLFAVLNNDLMAVEEIIASGALINFKGPDGKTALRIAVERNLVEMVELLLLQGAEPVMSADNEQSIFELTDNRVIHDLLKETLDWRHKAQLIPGKKLSQFFAIPI
jgi:hypothetical protein